MIKDMTSGKEETGNEQIVIADECGDTMWDAVLEQEVNACDIKVFSNNASSLLNSIDAVNELDVPKAS